jgi:hypothetical protein
MQVEIKSELFEDLENLQNINYILSVFNDKRRYNFFCDHKIIEKLAVYENLLPIDKAIIEEYYNRAVQGSIKSSHFIGKIADGDIFDLEEAKRFFNQPFIVVLENSFNDSFFLESLMKNFKSQSKALIRHKENGWLIYNNAGGFNNIINLFRGIMNNFKNLPKEKHKYLKCFVLVDSDKEFPNQATKPSRQTLFDFLGRICVPYHELEKREMENYMPDETLNTLKNNQEYLNAYLRLTPIQKDYFDLENGFPNNRFDQLDPEVQKLYSSISQEDYQTLRKYRFEPNKDFKSLFPKLFSNSTVTQETLTNRVAFQLQDPDELKTILIKISNSL